ncbi:hypothetical protein TNCV_814671 [Trichonephila clavipes]|nr:hypothetical protein TNCV_814671 [Trichonephila clavipes]
MSALRGLTFQSSGSYALVQIHRWRLSVTIIDHLRPVASVESGQSILHSATTFELPSVYVIPIALRFCVSVAHYAIPCGRCASKMPPAISNSNSVHYLFSSMSCSITARAKSVHKRTGRGEPCSSLVDARPC